MAHTNSWPALPPRLLAGGLFGLAYYAAAEAGRFLSFPASEFATFWPAGGLTVAALLLARPRYWWPLLAGSLIANVASDRLTHGHPAALGLASWAGTAIGGADHGVGAAPRRLPRRTAAADPRRVAAVPGGGGRRVAAQRVARRGRGGPAHRDRDRPGLGRLVGQRPPRHPPRHPRGPGLVRALRRRLVRPELLRAAETLVSLTALVAVGRVVFADVVADHSPLLQFPYLLFPFLLWAGVRLGPRGASAAVALLGVGAAYHTTRGQGPFDAVSHVVADQALLLQTFLGVAAFTALALAAEMAERADVAEALRASEDRLRDLVENAHDLIQSAAPDGRLLYVNPAWLATLKYDPGDVPGLNVFDVCHPEVRANFKGVFRRLFAREPVGHVEVRFVAKDGPEVILEGTVTCRFVDGRPVSTWGVFRDVTGRKVAERRWPSRRGGWRRRTPGWRRWPPPTRSPACPTAAPSTTPWPARPRSPRGPACRFR